MCGQIDQYGDIFLSIQFDVKCWTLDNEYGIFSSGLMSAIGGMLELK